MGGSVVGVYRVSRAANKRQGMLLGNEAESKFGNIYYGGAVFSINLDIE